MLKIGQTHIQFLWLELVKDMSDSPNYSQFEECSNRAMCDADNDKVCVE